MSDLGRIAFAMKLQLKQPILPMDALLVEEIPKGEGWLYEPKWDGFRCLVFRNGAKVFLQSKSGIAEQIGAAHRGSGFHRPCSGRAESLEH
jgi:ATP-dependent DNA ligase